MRSSVRLTFVCVRIIAIRGQVARCPIRTSSGAEEVRREGGQPVERGVEALVGGYEVAAVVGLPVALEERRRRWTTDD